MPRAPTATEEGIAALKEIAADLEDRSYRPGATPLSAHDLRDLAFSIRSAISRLSISSPREILDAIRDAAAECRSAGSDLGEIADRFEKQHRLGT